MTEGMTPADVAAVTRANDGYNSWGGEWFIWIILLAFLFNGNWGNNGNAIANDTLLADEFIKRDIFNTNQNVSNTACQTQRDVLENRYATQLAAANLGTQVQLGTAETQKEVLQSRYDAALQNQNMQAQLQNCCCELKTAIHSEGEATRALIQENTIQELREKLSDRDRDLQAANFQISQVAQTSNIINTVRPFPQPAYLTASPYTAYNGFAPFPGAVA